MKLYKVPRNSYIVLNNRTYFFKHLDGLRLSALCLDKNNNPIHIPAYAEVTLLNSPKPTRLVN